MDPVKETALDSAEAERKVRESAIAQAKQGLNLRKGGILQAMEGYPGLAESVFWECADNGWAEAAGACAFALGSSGWKSARNPLLAALECKVPEARLPLLKALEEPAGYGHWQETFGLLGQRSGAWGPAARAWLMARRKFFEACSNLDMVGIKAMKMRSVSPNAGRCAGLALAVESAKGLMGGPKGFGALEAVKLLLSDYVQGLDGGAAAEAARSSGSEALAKVFEKMSGAPVQAAKPAGPGSPGKKA